ncbi:hypothetical protein HYS54_01930 [Candidatus Micrarchaeota archaeon]|nr:hypothetical protein [Candidatus Micrarchaeota archaeon]
MADVDGLSDLGWSVYPAMVVKERMRPYCKCIGALRRGRVSRLYWAPFPPPRLVKEQFIRELMPFLDGHEEIKAKRKK